jgi:hypothetical protein
MAEMYMTRRVALAMSGDEADRCRALLQHALDGVRHLAQIDRVFDLGTPALRFEDNRIVQLTPYSRAATSSVSRFQHAHFQMRVLACLYGEYLLGGGRVLILAALSG